MKLTRRAFGAIALGAAATMSRPGWAAEAIKIGSVNPFSGTMAQYGDEVTRGYELAASLANSNGGLLGRQVEIVRGSATSPQEAIGTVEQLVGRDNVDILIGSYVSAISNAASEAALNYDKLYWETNSLALTLTERGLPNYVRSGPSSNEFALRSVEAALELVAPSIGKSAGELKVWLEHEDSSYGTSIKDEQARLFLEKGITAGIGSHSAKAIDVTDSILRAKSAAPDLWISTAYVGDTNLLLRAARDQGFKPAAIMLTGVGDTPETLSALGADFLEGVLLVSYPRPDVSPAYGPGAATYLEIYKKAYNRDPIAPQGMTAFVGAKILFDAINAAQSLEYGAIVEAAKQLDKPFGTYETGFGAAFNDTMQNTRALPVVAQWQSGTVKAVFPKEAVSDGVAVVNLPRA
jgi:branched-chain amino acid transport system substrate-binding protein